MLGIYAGNAVSLTGRKSVAYTPGWLEQRDDWSPVQRSHEVQFYESLFDFCVRRQPRSIVLYRKYALGDILMLLPVVRAFRRLLAIDFPIRIVVGVEFFNHLVEMNRSGQDDYRFLMDRGVRSYGADVHYNLNSALELDHRGGPESSMHRLELYAQSMGLRLAPMRLAA